MYADPQKLARERRQRRDVIAHLLTIGKVEVAADGFIPSPLQRAILDALDGRAVKTSKLEEIVARLYPHLQDPHRKLFKPGGLKELRERGLVANHRKFG